MIQMFCEREKLSLWLLPLIRSYSRVIREVNQHVPICLFIHIVKLYELRDTYRNFIDIYTNRLREDEPGVAAIATPTVIKCNRFFLYNSSLHKTI